MVLMTLLLLLASTALCAAALLLATPRAAREKPRYPARAEPAAGASPQHQESTRRVPRAPHAEPAAASLIEGRCARPISSATTPADPKAAAFRVRFGADNASHARNLTQPAAQPARS